MVFKNLIEYGSFSSIQLRKLNFQKKTCTVKILYISLQTEIHK
jgi:hypothetical protein